MLGMPDIALLKISNCIKLGNFPLEPSSLKNPEIISDCISSCTDPV